MAHWQEDDSQPKRGLLKKITHFAYSESNPFAISVLILVPVVIEAISVPPGPRRDAITCLFR